ncbi:MAG: SH3 domain-containing protein [Desulfobulbus sp.]|nr:SH3 domain-containing protein [Desulfobulbus sp.]
MVGSLLKKGALTLMGSFLLCSSGWGAEYLSVARDGINVRSGPGTNASVLFELPMGYPLEVVSREGQWVKVMDYEGDKGYVVDSLLSKTPYVIIKVKECNVRSGPSTTDPVVGNVVKDVIFQKVEQKGDWVKISHPQLTGWVHKTLVWPN